MKLQIRIVHLPTLLSLFSKALSDLYVPHDSAIVINKSSCLPLLLFETQQQGGVTHLNATGPNSSFSLSLASAQG